MPKGFFFGHRDFYKNTVSIAELKESDDLRKFITGYDTIKGYVVTKGIIFKASKPYYNRDKGNWRSKKV